MSVCIIYHSETGNTRAAAEDLAAATGGDLVEVNDLADYAGVGMYLKGAPRALRGKKAAIEPDVIDVSGYETVVIGSPVWAGHPTPAVNAAIAGLQGIEGKTAVVFCTSRGLPGKTLERMQEMLTERGASVRGAVSFTDQDLQNPGTMETLIDLVMPLAGSR
jgi:flavodoxin